MAPEAMTQHVMNASGDVYSFAMLMYEVCIMNSLSPRLIIDGSLIDLYRPSSFREHYDSELVQGNRANA